MRWNGFNSFIGIQGAVESFVFPDRIDSISIEIPQKLDRLYFFSMESLEDYVFSKREAWIKTRKKVFKAILASDCYHCIACFFLLLFFAGLTDWWRSCYTYMSLFKVRWIPKKPFLYARIQLEIGASVSQVLKLLIPFGPRIINMSSVFKLAWCNTSNCSPKTT